MFRNGRPSEMLRRKAENGAGSGGAAERDAQAAKPGAGQGEGSAKQPSGSDAQDAGETPASKDEEIFDKTRAMETIRKLRDELKEAQGKGKRLKELEDAEAQRQLAQMTEAEKAVAAQKTLTDKIAAYEQQVQALRQETVRYEVMLAAQGLSVIDLDAAYRLLDLGSLEFDEATGKPTNVDKALKDLIKAKPYLVKQEQKGSGMGTPAQQQQQRKPSGTPTGTGERRVTPL